MAPGTYRLWKRDRGSWCDYDIVGDKTYAAAIRGLLPIDWSGDPLEVRRDFELVPELHNPVDPWAIAVRADGRTVGHLPSEDCQLWAGVVQRVIASGCVPVVPGRVYAYEADGWGSAGIEMRATVQLSLGDPETALPLNDPPPVPYTFLPRSSIVQVTKEDEHFDALLRFVPPGGYGLLFVTLHEDASRASRPVVEVRIDDVRIGQLTPQMSQRFLPMIRHLADRGLVTACWGDITGSSVAAEVRIDGVKANEADTTLLEGDPLTIPPLVVQRVLYDIQGLVPLEVAPDAQVVEMIAPRVVAEPPDGSVVRFPMGRHGRYHYVAVRRGASWETTATSDREPESGGAQSPGTWAINQVMQWDDLCPQVRA